jgi:hypothetical protein
MHVWKYYNETLLYNQYILIKINFTEVESRLIATRGQGQGSWGKDGENLISAY